MYAALKSKSDPQKTEKTMCEGLVPNRGHVETTAAQFWFCPFSKEKYRNKSDKNSLFLYN